MAVVCLQKMAIEEVALTDLSVLRFVRYLHAYVSGCWSNDIGLRGNRTLLITVGYLHVNRNLWRVF